MRTPILLALALAVLGTPGAALAQRHVIEPGREAEVMALFSPYELGGEVTPGWSFDGIAIERDQIIATVEGPADARGTLRLEHVEAAASPRRSRNFAVAVEAEDPGAGPALDALAESVIANDVRPFWRQREEPGATPLARASRYLDGTVVAALGLFLLLALVGSQLRDAPRWVAVALVAIVLGGGALRAALAPETALGVWPYTRVLRLASSMFEGPALGALTHAFSLRLHLTELVFATNLVVATLTPLAMYAHGHYVLRDPRAALACAGMLVVFPNHIRFSHSEVEFILSLALSSITLALAHAALVDRSRVRRVISTVVLPFALYASILTRELNILLVPLLLAVALTLRGDAPWARLGWVVAGVAGGAAFGTAYLLHAYPDQVRDGLSLDTAWNAITALFSVHHNTLINPRVTPLGVTALAIAGTVWMWRTGERRHVLFLLGWLGFYFAAHSYVLPRALEMQARYHLHLAPPLLLLAAPALVMLWERRRRLAYAVLTYLAAAPLLHVGFIRDVDFNDMREYEFVRSAREHLPDGCVVLEYQGENDMGVRFARIGTVLDEGRIGRRWRVVPAATTDGGSEVLREEVGALLADPPECLAYYEGLNCWAVKDVAAPIAPACAALRTAAPLEELARTSFASRPYDENLSEGFGPDLAHLTLTLFRVRPRGEAPRHPVE